MSQNSCCVPRCRVTKKSGVVLHRFPNPDLNAEKFSTWISKIGGEIVTMDSLCVYANRRVCDKHFEVIQKSPTMMCKLDIPTLNLPEQLKTDEDDTETLTPPALPSKSGVVLVAKRELPDETASPSTLQGNPKRMRTQTAQEEHRTYARDTQSIPPWLIAVICFSPPSRHLTLTEATHIQTELERLIMETDSTKPLPAFRGYPRLADGTLQMWCVDDNALTWLTQNVPDIRLPETDLTLTITRKTDKPTSVRAALFVPRYNGDIARLQSLLIRQNTWYDIGRWSLYRATSVGGDNHGTYLTLGIPADEVEKVLERERRISFLLGSLYIRFYSKTQPSDLTETETETTELTQTDQMTQLEGEMAEAAMASSSGWTTQLLASSPTCVNWHGKEEADSLSDGSVSS